MRNFTVLVLFALCAAQFQHAAAQAPGSYPSRPIRMIAPSSPGGPVDVLARILALGMTGTLGQHTDEVLSKLLNLDDAAIATLRSNGIV